MAKAQILVVEDESIVASDIRARLNKLGYAVTAIASSGEEAIRKTAQTRPDLILMDIKLQGEIDGVEATKQIRLRFDVPVVYLTAYADKATLQRAKITGPLGYLVKPFEERELYSTIEMALYKHKLEQDLRESWHWLGATLESIGEAVIATDAQGQIKFFNPLAQALTGWQDNDAFGKPVAELVRLVHEATRTPMENPVEQAFRQGDVIRLTNTILVARDGTEIPVDASVAPILDEQKTITGVVLVFSDITERRQAEEKLHRLHEELELRVQSRTEELATTNEILKQEIIEREQAERALKESLTRIEQAKQEWETTADSLPQFVCLLDQQGRIRRTNRTVEHWGLGPVSEVRGQSLHDLFHPACHDQDCYLQRFWTQAWAGLAEDRSSECEAEDKLLGRHLHFLIRPNSTYSVRSETSVGSFGVIVVQDITERKRAEEALQKAHNELEQRVQDRTAELANANAALRQEIIEREQAEAARRESEERFRQVITSISDHVYMTKINEDGGRTNLYLSPHVEALTGYSQQEFIDDWRFWPSIVIHPDDRAIAAAQAEALARGQAGESEYRLIRADGEIIWVRDSGQVEQEPGSQSMIVYGVVSDITKRKQAEIENLRLQAQTKTWAEELAILNEAGQAMTSTLDLDAVLRQMMGQVNTLFRAEIASVLLHDPAADELVFASVATPEAEILVGTRLPTTTGVAGWVMQQKKPLLLENAQQDPRFYNGIDLITGLTTRSLLAVPLIAKQKAIGVVEVINKASGSFDQHDLEIMEILAGSATIALENARLFEQVRTGREQMRRLAQQAVSAHEEERQRLSYELHDEAGQALTALKMTLEMIQLDLPDEAQAYRQRLGEAVTLADTTMERLRSLARNLRPPALDMMGLNSTLEGLCREFAGRTQLSIAYEGSEPDQIQDSAKVCLYRFLQETLTNVAKHARAYQVWVKLDTNGREVSLTVKDDGQGFQKEVEQAISGQLKGIGLLGILERLELLGGRLQVKSQPSHGACLTAYLPLEERI